MEAEAVAFGREGLFPSKLYLYFLGKERDLQISPEFSHYFNGDVH